MGIYKCHFCRVCNGFGCIGQLPGMGGVFESANFIDNCITWKKYHTESTEHSTFPTVRLAPMTGAIENIGYETEEPFYEDIITASAAAGFSLSIGDGYPDTKLQFGINALKKHHMQAAVFIKPYPQPRIFERVDWAGDSANIIGVDIDAYNIVTMRNLVQLEKKDAKALKEIKKYAQKPFAVKGVFTTQDIELIKELKPDITVISNHGGRIETRRGNTADFLAEHGSELQRYSGEVWVDGGLRTRADVAAAGVLGAAQVMIGRPCITALIRNGSQGLKALYSLLAHERKL